MTGRQAYYHFGRLNLIISSIYPDKKTFLLSTFKKGFALNVGKHNWGVFEIAELDQDSEKYIHGYFVKFRPQSDDEIANTSTQQLNVEEIRNRTVAKSRFFLHVSTGLIAYTTSGNHITDNIFRKYFARLIEEANGGFFLSAEVLSVEERYKIFEALKLLVKINKLKLYLHPTNPSFSPIYKKIDERLKKLEAGSYSEIYKSKDSEKGLNISEDSDIESKITMADDGYGEASIEGVNQEGEVKQISTKDSPITAVVPKEEENTDSILIILSKTFDQIRRRISNEK